MNNSLQRIKAWRSRRQLRSLERSLQQWEQLRVKGKARFIVSTALTYGLAMAGILDVLDNVFYGGAKYSLLENTIVYLLVGIVVGFGGWSAMEAKYKDALSKARGKASPSGELPPHNSSLRITADSESK